MRYLSISIGIFSFSDFLRLPFEDKTKTSDMLLDALEKRYDMYYFQNDIQHFFYSIRNLLV